MIPKPELRIRTQDGVTFAYRLAGPFSRFLAWLTDLVIVIGLSSLVSSLTQLIGFLPSIAGAATVLLGFVIWTGYGIFCEALLRGQTVGKRFLRLRVVDQTGHSLSFSQIVVRNLLRSVDMLPVLGLLGGICILLNRYGQRLGDLAAGTVVIMHSRFAPPDFSQLAVPKYNSLREHPHLAARLRQLTNPEMAAILLDALMRRETLDPQSRAELFAALSEHLRKLVRFPEPVLIGVSDEQFVRNVVDIVYREKAGSPT
ncbi:MAG: putative RDD family membrane protein YckC [Rhodothermales bacterium]|jgi:uncharacterized RDD family membrane protein YckC